MNCDDVFVILTRGPFPSGSRHDEAVEDHLQICPDCQRLAEALRPSSELFQESISTEERQALPGYWGDSLVAPRDLAVSLRDITGYPRPKPNSWRLPANGVAGRNLNLRQFTVAVVVGIVLAAALRTLFVTRSPSALWAADARTGDTPDGMRGPTAAGAADEIDLLSLPAQCRQGSFAATPSIVAPDSFNEPTPLASSAARGENCCTQCHHAGNAIRISKPAMRQLERSCRACHR